MWAGRPFFITTGVTQASWAPAASRAPTVWASTSPVTSSTLVSSSTTGWPVGRAAAAVPTTTWVALGRSASSRPPAPKPLAATVMAGMAPQPVHRPARMAAPVGVVSSTPTSTPCVGAPCSRATTAGGGVGQHAVGRAHGAETGGHRAGPHLVHPQHLEGGARAHHVHDGVDAAHLVEVHLGHGPAVQAPLHLGQGVEHGQARSRTRSGRRASSTRPTMWA